MVDITADFRQLVQDAGGHVGEPKFVKAGAFIQTATELRLRLAAVRREVRLQEEDQTPAIRECQDQMAEIERQTEEFDASAPPPARRQDLLVHRRGVVQALYQELGELASKVQSTAVAELQHQNDVANYFTAPLRESAPKVEIPDVAFDSGGAMDFSSKEYNPDLGAELDNEEKALLCMFESDMDRIKETQTKVEEVSSIMNVFAAKVEEQAELADQILSLAEDSTAYVEEAEKHLQKAVENSNSYRFYVVCWFIGSGTFLLIFDYIDANWFLF
eukprot:gnl/MRDRNA2_/MRDRNA2_105059_c0_seq1.p1 gnl/MRDRNA2_/MRDRNA2_105059_c0~~gnl/MRDRNA2_/MRDRNA2_105059_c0_seq1.p1  ORF type:complete len:274 (-),score=78.36 gnl/MRDRNA2_/MRDRNA2_105059_c0_seq1:93-914(-)